MPQSGVLEVQRLLQGEDGHVVLDSALASPDEEMPVDLCLQRTGLGGEGSRLVLIRDVMLA